jgi:hypothetical protein
MRNIKYKDEMDLIYMLTDLTGIRNIREQDEIGIDTMLLMASVICSKLSIPSSMCFCTTTLYIVSMPISSCSLKTYLHITI